MHWQQYLPTDLLSYLNMSTWVPPVQTTCLSTYLSWLVTGSALSCPHRAKGLSTRELAISTSHMHVCTWMHKQFYSFFWCVFVWGRSGSYVRKKWVLRVLPRVFWHFLCEVLSGQAKQSASFRPNPPCLLRHVVSPFWQLLFALSSIGSLPWYG